MRGNSLWFTGLPVRRFGDLAVGATLWYRDFATRYSAQPNSVNLAVARETFTYRSKYKGYGLLGVRYFVMPAWSKLNDPSGSPPTDAAPRFPVVYDAEVKIFENPAALPRVYVAHDVVGAPDFETAQHLATRAEFDALKSVVLETEVPIAETPRAARQPDHAAVRILEYAPDRVEIAAETSRRGVLVLTDLDYPGWVAEVDGKTVPIHRVNGLTRGVWIEAGQHRVSFTYRPQSFRVGLLLAAMAVIAWTSLAWLGRRRMRRRATRESSR